MKNNLFNDRNVLNMVRISREVVTVVYRNEQTDRQAGSKIGSWNATVTFLNVTSCCDTNTQR
jgi:hypothetical protein